jgi:hypothetical protein
MPLKWERGTNPYVHNYFGKLRVGPTMRPAGMLQRAKDLIQRLDEETIELRGISLDEYLIKEAARKLSEPGGGALAQELLLVHPPHQGESKKLKVLAANISELATVAEERPRLMLLHEAAIFWFTPLPGSECATLPEWEDFSFTRSNDEADLDLDIIFDS